MIRIYYGVVVGSGITRSPRLALFISDTVALLNVMCCDPVFTCPVNPNCPSLLRDTVHSTLLSPKAPSRAKKSSKVFLVIRVSSPPCHTYNSAAFRI